MVAGAADASGRTVFVFPGQGAQWVGMGAELLDESPVFAARMAECARGAGAVRGLVAVGVLRDEAELERVDVVQPVSLAVMVSLAAVVAVARRRPDAVVGHSQGEIAAAVVAGALSLEDGARVVALRSKAIARTLAGRGGMVSVALPLAEVEPRLPAGLSIAAVNGPASVVVAGDPEPSTRCSALTADGGPGPAHPVDYASHSAHVDLLRDELLAVLGADHATRAGGAVPLDGRRCDRRSTPSTGSATCASRSDSSPPFGRWPRPGTACSSR